MVVFECLRREVEKVSCDGLQSFHILKSTVPLLPKLSSLSGLVTQHTSQSPPITTPSFSTVGGVEGRGMVVFECLRREVEKVSCDGLQSFHPHQVTRCDMEPRYTPGLDNLFLYVHPILIPFSLLLLYSVEGRGMVVFECLRREVEKVSCDGLQSFHPHQVMLPCPA
jgi:hypothetical protein